jgi:hypothetical protein
MSGTFTGKARLSDAGRPRLRVAAWRAVWGCLQNNRAFAARYRHLTSRETNRLTPTQAQTIVAAAILRQLYAVITTGQVWDSDVAAHRTRQPTTVGWLRRNPNRVSQSRVTSQVGASHPRH